MTRYYIDTHDRQKGTFPEQIDAEGFRAFATKYGDACAAEGVTLLALFVSLDEGKAYCHTSAPNTDAVLRAHERVGLPFDGITEVKTVSPADLYF